MTFTMSNSYGFTQTQIDTLNSARALLIERDILDRVPEDHLDDLISNAWMGDETAEEIAARVERRA